MNEQGKFQYVACPYNAKSLLTSMGCSNTKPIREVTEKSGHKPINLGLITWSNLLKETVWLKITLFVQFSQNIITNNCHTGSTSNCINCHKTSIYVATPPRNPLSAPKKASVCVHTFNNKFQAYFMLQ